ncbi:hypothetical protein N9B67_03380 [Algibacter sp.]|nr:hypothetical protein [Algibacter sp.]
MALTQVTNELIAAGGVHTNNIANNSVNSTKVNDSIIKTITLTQAEYDALGSYSSSTIYITT